MVSVVLAVLLASGVAFVAASQRAEAAFPGGNGDIAFARNTTNTPGDTDIFRMRPDGTHVKRLTDLPPDPETESAQGAYDPAWSSDGTKIAFQWSTDYEYGGYNAVMDARVGSDETIIGRYSTNGDYVEDHQHPSWYPSANKLAFAGFTGTFLGEDNYDLYTMTFDAAGNATGTTRLTTDGAIDRFPAVSPDGEKIAFTSDRKTGPSGPGDYEIYVMEADKPEGPDNPAVRLTDNDTDDWSGDWSPDGKKIVYTGRRNGNSEVLVMNASDGTSKKNLTKNAAQDSSPAWSPDGRYIVFVRTHDSRDSKDYEIWKMRADGSDPTRLTRNTLYECCPDWQPRD